MDRARITMTNFALMSCILALPSTGWAIDQDDSSGPAYVINGTPAEAGTWPDTAAVFLRNFPECTGVLIAPDVALTAAHCDSNITQIKVDATDSMGSGEIIEVASTHSYPQHNRTYDISVVVLAEEATTEPRQLALDCIIEDDLYDGADVAVVGFGITTTQGWDDNTTLMEGFTQVLDHDCSDNNVYDCNRDVQPGGELVAGGNGVDSCSGDSGGPLYLLTDHGDYLVGITSRAANWTGPSCGEGGIYVRPDAIIDWIEETSGRSIPRPDCGDTGGDEGGTTTGGEGGTTTGGEGGTTTGGEGTGSTGDTDTSPGALDTASDQQLGGAETQVGGCGCSAGPPLQAGLLVGLSGLLGLSLRRRQH